MNYSFLVKKLFAFAVRTVYNQSKTDHNITYQ